MGGDAGQPVSDWLYNWIYVGGYPLLNVTIDADNGVHVSQVGQLALCVHHFCGQLAMPVLTWRFSPSTLMATCSCYCMSLEAMFSDRVVQQQAGHILKELKLAFCTAQHWLARPALEAAENLSPILIHMMPLAASSCRC